MAKQTTQAAPGGETGGDKHPRAVEAQTERRRRKNMGRGARLKLSIPPHLENDPNYRYYWAKDVPGRIEALTVQDDYEFVTDEMTAGDSRNTGQGTRIERHADVDKFGNPVRHYLLRKPIDYHRADEAEKLEHRKKLMRAIKAGKTPNEKGEAVQSDGSYIPSRGISISEGASADYNP